MRRLVSGLRWLFGTRRGARGSLIARWLFLRALSGIYFSAFYSLAFQIKGLTGPVGILPARDYLAAVGRTGGLARYWQAPSLFWISAGTAMMVAVTGAGLAASVLAFLNVWPRMSLFVCWICFLAFVASASDFSSYQSDGMLLEAGFLALFFAPAGLRPGLGLASLPSRASLVLLLWEWFRIYFQSGMVKMMSGDPQWRDLTAMDHYYQNGPLPTWVGWYVEHLPHWFHAGTVVLTLVLEFAIVWMVVFPRWVRLICFLIVTPWELGVILTANYAFLNYLVLSLGILLVDDRYLWRFVPARLRQVWRVDGLALETGGDNATRGTVAHGSDVGHAGAWELAQMGVAGFALSWVAYATVVELVHMVWRDPPLPTGPVRALYPLRIANQYGLFAVMTRGRYEIEFQGSDDGVNWTPYLFRHKPQLLDERPGIYAPYQPRFDWNLWFASLGDWRQNDIVPLTEEALLEGRSDVLALFRADPFGGTPPRYVRAVLWQYWFTTRDEKRRTGMWWRRSLLGLYAPGLTRTEGGRFRMVEVPSELPAHD